IVGRLGFGNAAVGVSALSLGRLIVAWGCLGMSDACLEVVCPHTRDTIRFGKPIGEHQLVALLIAKMAVARRNAMFNCVDAARQNDRGGPEAIHATYFAKYTATKALSMIGKSAVQILGAKGCIDSSIAARAYRNSKVMEIIE